MRSAERHSARAAIPATEDQAAYFGGLLLRSDFAIAGLRDAGAADVGAAGDLSLALSHGPAPTPDTEVFAWPGRYQTRLGTIGADWIVSSALDGVFVVNPALTRVSVHSAAAPPRLALADVLVRRILPRLITARGAVTLHAAAVADSHRAFLLLGDSGAGKSTLTAALAATPQWDLLSDDLSMIWPGDPPLVAPGATGVCIWPASRDGLALDRDACTPMPGYDGKVRFDPPGVRTITAVPLGAMVFLARDRATERPVLTPVNRAEALIRAARQLILFNPAGPRSGEYARLLARLNAVLRDVPILRLTYPSRYAALPEVTGLLSEVAR